MDTPADVASEASEASKRNHEQNLDNAKTAIRSVPLELREFNSVCLNLSLDQMDKAKALIRAFKQEFIKVMEASPGKGDSTYQLQIQLFPFTQTETKSRKELLQ